MKMCFRVTKRKSNKYLAILVFVILVYLVFIFYLAYYQPPLQSHILSSYVLDSNGQTLYEQDDPDMAASRIHHFGQTCNEKTNFVFIKCMKCATSTLLGVFYRFGYMRNLSFVIPQYNNIYLNWPFPMTIQDFRPSSHGYNILTDHAIYTENIMEIIMPKDTVYISIIREPFAQLKSVFQYFNVAKISGMSENVTNPIIEYLSHLEKYESAYKAHEAKARWCIPDGFSITKNIMSHCHGMPLGFPSGTENISADSTAVDQYIKHLGSKFSLIMIVEYFYESIILLRRMMCWSFREIIFVKSNIADYNFKYSPVPENILDIHRHWSNADYKLYQYFNNTLWKQISRQSSDFYSEVEAFNLVEMQVQNYCLQLYSTFKREQYPVNMTETVIEASAWNNKFSISSEDCWMLGPDTGFLRKKVQKENDRSEAHLLTEQQNIKDNRTLKGQC